MLYQMVELKEGVDVQYLGVYALKWRHGEWGPPSVGFVERNVFDLVPAGQYEQLLQKHEALQELVAVRDCGLVELQQMIEALGEQIYRSDVLTKAVDNQLRAALQEIWEEVQGDFDRDIIYTAAKNVVG